MRSGAWNTRDSLCFPTLATSVKLSLKLAAPAVWVLVLPTVLVTAGRSAASFGACATPSTAAPAPTTASRPRSSQAVRCLDSLIPETLRQFGWVDDHGHLGAG